jgi:DNA-binding transcriptional ArsR family regulator
MTNAPRDLVFTALADGTRRRIVEMLAGGSYRVNDLAAELGVTRQAVAKHLDVLADAGMTETDRRGRERLTSLRRSGLQPLRDWLDHYDRFWTERLQTLKRQIEEKDEI